jgi:hypothetical protein
LVRGNFPEGWPLYEWRKRRVAPEAFHALGRPEWSGREDLTGKTLFIEAEQGLGDTIQFCRYAPMAADRGAHVIVTVQPSLVRLLQSLDSRIEIAPVAAIPSAFDYHIPLLSLPGAFGTEVACIPAAIPYLHVDTGQIARMSSRIGGAGFKIGICWQGSYIAGARSFCLRHLEGISQLPGVRLISLQKGDGIEQLGSRPDAMAVESLGGNFPEDFAETAAAMETLDLIITCDTSVAHLAGALGRPVWVALRNAPDWRWLLDRQDSPWYPGMRLFRQTAPGDWRGVFAKIEAELEIILTKRKSD